MWTKDAPSKAKNDTRGASKRSLRPSGGGVFGIILGAIAMLFRTIGRGFASVGRAIATLCRRSRAGMAVLIIVVVLLVGGVYDYASNLNKVYGNVMIGEVNVGGMTILEAENAVAQTYGGRLNGSGVTLYASQDALDSHAQNPETDDMESVEETNAKTVQWTTDAGTLQAYIDYDALGNAAMKTGRAGVLDRLGLFFAPQTINVPVNYNQACIETLAQNVDATLGYEKVDYGISVEEGTATVTPGNDGNMMNRSTLKDTLTRLLLAGDSTPREFVATVEYTPVTISQAAAQTAADQVNAAIKNGAEFTSGSASWTATPATLGDWVQTTVSDSQGEAVLQPSFSAAEAKSEIVTHIQATFQNNSGHVTFSQDNGVINVHVQDTTGTMPLIGDAIATLNRELFGSSDHPASGETPTITISSTEIPETMTFDDAINYGVISAISEFTTEYTTGAVARNTNIHLAADLLNNSIVSSNGGQWSFNDIAGECNAEKGFQSAGAIVDDETVDEIGGGICQVATTIFNSVYNAGYPVTSRVNHSLYISSYPAGRDAAISWPAPDLKWKNDTSSDILLRMSYTNSSVTATLYGINPGYQVSTETGDWQEGDKSKTVYKYDSTLSKSYSYTKTKGVDGRKITVTRTVKDASGTVLHTDAFYSEYSAQNTVIVRGGTEADWPASSSSTSTTS